MSRRRRLTPSIARSSRRPTRDIAVIPRSEDADDDLLHLAFFGNEVLYAMQLDDEEARVLLATLRKAVDLLTERLGPSTAELPAFPGEAHRPQKQRRRRPPPPRPPRR